MESLKSTESPLIKYKDTPVWNKCIILWTKNGGCNTRSLLSTNIKESKVLEIKDNYLKAKGTCEDLWLDVKKGLAFSSSDNYFNQPFEFSFLNTKEDFVKGTTNGLHFVRRNYSFLFNRGFLCSDELITDLPEEEIKKYKDKKILILGAGPTLKERFDDLDLDSYDFIWSCTKFFLNPKIKDIELDLLSIGGNVSLDDPALKEYMTKNPNTKYGIECFVQPFKTKDELKEFRDRNGADRGFTFQTRYQSKLGAGPRLLALAAIFKASQVHFLGIDGHPLGYEHSFEDTKEYKTKEKDGVEEAPTRSDSKNAYRRQFCLLWQYLFSFPNTEFINLGQGHKGNQSTDIFS